LQPRGRPQGLRQAQRTPGARAHPRLLRGAPAVSAAFELDPRLAADSVFVADGPLSQVRLMDDTRFAWLLLVPRVAGVTEWIDLDGNQQRLLLAEINRASQVLRATPGITKLNIGALGNIVSQLHVQIGRAHVST